MHIYSEKEIREIDHQAEKNGLPVFTLMENAGAGLYKALAGKISKRQTVCIAAGKGNNGGDGIVLARYLLINGYQASIYLPFGPPDESSPAGKHLAYLRACGYNAETEWLHADVLVDALLGTGFHPPLKEEAAGVIRALNEEKAMKVSIDLPSGIQADTGTVNEGFEADFTLCLHGFKPSAFLMPSERYYGETEVVDIGLPQTGNKRVWSGEDAGMTLPAIHSTAHKGTFGTGYLLAGSDTMPGSALLAAKGAIRSGAGKLIIGTSRFAAGAIAGAVPEATYEIDGFYKTAKGKLPDKIKAAAIGPGLEEEDAMERCVKTLLAEEDLPVVLDAGAIQKRKYSKRKIPPILTPHPGEMSRITGLSIEDIQSRRIEAAGQYAKEQHVIVVLKGRHTVMAFPDGDVYVNPTGNAALAKGGSGDSLTGIILAFLCTHSSIKEAVANAVYLHGSTADLWVESGGERSMAASDIPELIPAVMKKLEEKRRRAE
ncbi:NAD(P)H-hydrate dehydratase [Bacillus mangrovi]|uniref:Bifunctional NAD(P)H-hydrate repair enzyme n=1 Tax=Metabacillus mangrovi TaxID=1491830 RepID=A0A7X2S9T5_9BACI|nr:NAD(P)H-hydrate dehydratase [Metabacillus mangrovi]MTH55765.1 NAD(P)H-hydrate dehydratase [Metabacillus mangrovi]